MKRVRKIFGIIDEYWYAPMPAERLSLLRIAVGVFALAYLCIRVGNLTSVARFQPSQFDPVGPVVLLSKPLGPELVYAVAALAIVSGFAFVLGFRYRVSGPVFALLFLWVTSYRSSWGMKFHTENLLALHLILLALAPAADVLCVGARNASVLGLGTQNLRVGPQRIHFFGAGAALPMTSAHVERASPDGRYGWAIRAMCMVTVVTYVLAGVAKLRSSGWEWAMGEILQQHIAYDNLRKIELGSIHSPLGVVLIRYDWVFPPLGWATLLLELGAPLVLFNRRLGVAWASTAWLFHVGVLLLMAIAFPYQLSTVAYLSFVRVERILDSPKLQKLFRRR